MLEVLGVIGLIGIGVVIGNQLTFWTSVRPLIDKLTKLRYAGFRPEEPIPEHPKTVPFPRPNET